MKKLNNLINSIKTFLINKPKTSVVIAALATILSYAPFSIWALMFISIIVLIFCLKNETSKKQRAIIFALYIIVFNAINLHWVGNSFIYNSPEPYLVYLMPLLIIGMALLLSILYVLLFVVLDFIKPSRAKDILLIPVVFIVVELLRSFSVFGFPWNLVGYSIASNDYLLQISEFGTILLPSFLILIIASLLATFKRKYVFAGLGLFIIWLALGALRYNSINRDGLKLLTTETALIQIDTIEHHNFDRIKMRKQFFRYLDKIKQAKANKEIKVIVLPEMAVPYPVNNEDNLLKLLQDNIREDQILVVGSPAYYGYDIYNSMYFITKEGLKQYDKKMLVPFGEFIPFRDVVPFLKNFTNGFKDFSVGTNSNNIKVKNKTFLGLICYEAIFPFFIKEHLKDKNTILLNITNDAWFYGTVAPYQHALISKTRSVENNVLMIRTVNAGISFVN